MSNQTILESNVTIHDCIRAAENFLKNSSPNEKWEIKTKSDKQKRFIELTPSKETFNLYSEEELESRASFVVKDINSWLLQKGFEIQLAEVGPLTFAVASIMKINTFWKKEGIDTRIHKNSCVYSAFLLKLGTDDIEIFQNEEISANPLFAIKTKSKDTVLLMKRNFTENFLFPMEMFSRLKTISYKKTSCYDHTVILPNLNLDVKPDISWICGLSFGMWEISQALHQIKFKLHKKGTEVKVASGMSLSGSLSFNKTYTKFDEPFYVWLCREGAEEPYFGGYIDMDSFQEEEK
jgi:hypothetical protein